MTTANAESEPVPYCDECDEPLTWCFHGNGEAWKTAAFDGIPLLGTPDHPED